MGPEPTVEVAHHRADLGQVRQLLHDAWLAVHIRRFDRDYSVVGQEPPEYAKQATPDCIYRGIQLAERAIGEVAEQHGISYHALRDLRVPVEKEIADTLDQPSNPPAKRGDT